MATIRGWSGNAVNWGKPIVPAMGDALGYKRRMWDQGRRDRAAGEAWAGTIPEAQTALPEASGPVPVPTMILPPPEAPEVKPLSEPGRSWASASPPSPPPSVGGGYVPGTVTDRFMVDAPLKPMAPWPEDWSDLSPRRILPEAPTPETGVFRGGERWTPTLPGAMGTEEFEADVSRRAEGRAASAGWDADAARGASLSKRIAGMGSVLGRPLPEAAWDEYNRRTSDTRLRMGIGAPDPDNDRDMATWAAGQADMSGKGRYSPQERAGFAANAERYDRGIAAERAAEDRAARLAAEERMAEAERAGDWATDPTGSLLYNKRTRETVPTGVERRAEPKRYIVNGAMVDAEGKEIYRAPDDEQIIPGMTVQQFEHFSDPYYQAGWTPEQKADWARITRAYLSELTKRATQPRRKPAGAAGGGAFWDPNAE